VSVLHQQRIRIVATCDGSRDSWAVFCPCCITGQTFTTWSAAVDWAEMHLLEEHCRYCIDRQMPAGRDDLMGELFERCPACTAPCGICDGISVYPANYNTPTELVEDLAVLRLTPIFCDACAGVIAIAPLDPEVYA
jgi:hypothetical protein